MKARLYTEDDYADLASWSNTHGVQVMHACRYKVGAVAFDNEKKYAMAFLYMSNAGEGICFLSWLTANPSNSSLESARACKLIINALGKVAQVNDYAVMFTQSLGGHVKMWERQGFNSNHSVVPMFRVLEPLTQKEAV